ncbi:MAG: radical SAM protein [Pseudomonadota bacterium]|nr:radical SAM protein [Pseudomonadota bacterium]
MVKPVMISMCEIKNDEPVIVGTRVELQLLTTLKCNLRCSYCVLGVGDILNSQKHASYTVDQLKAFIGTHLAGKEIYISLYGGEPTLNTRFILELMDKLPLSRFNLQTNGTLLDRVPEKILARLSNVMVSLDGGKEVTDGYRGGGVYDKVMRNVEKVRHNLSGTLTARVTWWSGETSFEELDELTRTFDYLYFQFAQDEGAYGPESVEKKKQVLSRLVERFFLGREFYPVVPLMGTVRNKVLPSRMYESAAGLSQCRVSTNLLNIMPDGKIYPCPDMMYLPELLQGDVVANWVRKSPLQPHPDMPCEGCSAFHFCRRNCMKNMHLAYVKGNDNWKKNVTEPTCDLIRFMGEEVDRYHPDLWFAKAPLSYRNKIAGAEVYEYCEVMP